MATPHRTFRIGNALHKRQTDISIAFDGVHDPHNLSAVCRTCDAVGIGEIIWQPDTEKPEPPNPDVAMGTQRWVRWRVSRDLPGLLAKKKSQGYSIAVTHLGRKAVDFREVDWTRPWIVVVGNEKRGCSEEVVRIADVNILLPMAGFVQSLNVSVAAAVILFEIQRQRSLAGMYERRQPMKKIRALFKAWGLSQEGFQPEDFREVLAGEPEPGPGDHIDGRALRTGKPPKHPLTARSRK